MQHATEFNKNWSRRTIRKFIFWTNKFNKFLAAVERWCLDGEAMKLPAITIALALLPVLKQAGLAQGFVNLDFESANLAAIPAGQIGGLVSATNAIPGWLAFMDGNQLTQVYQNFLSVGAPVLSIVGPDLPAFQGNYSFLLTAGVGGHTVSIAQTALVPATASSIFFEASGNYVGSGTFLVSLGGQNLNYTMLSTASNYTVYGADISSFSGQTETLSFSDASIGSNFSYEELDNIQFSPSPVPEPSALVSFILGVTLLGLRHKS